jgi:hypothetical protein
VKKVRNAYRILVGRHPLGRPERWLDNIKIDLREIKCGWKWLRIMLYGILLH